MDECHRRVSSVEKFKTSGQQPEWTEHHGHENREPYAQGVTKYRNRDGGALVIYKSKIQKIMLH